MWSALLILTACNEYGVQDFAKQDAWEVPDNKASADILFVVDNSASMSEEQQNLADNFMAFIGVLAESRADWRMGVTTTDASDNGTLRSGILEPLTDDLEARFRDAVLVGSEGSRDEQGFAASGQALEANPDFIREDAELDIVYVSDEDDHSPAPVDQYVELLTRYAGNEKLFLHALVGDLPEGCASGTSAADAGSRYLEAAVLTQGLTESICVEDYSNILTQVGLKVAGWQTTFALSSLASPGSLAVTVDGIAIPEREVDGWQYDIGQNAVVFSGRAVPRPGMWVVVDYERWLGGDHATAEAPN